MVAVVSSGVTIASLRAQSATACIGSINFDGLGRRTSCRFDVFDADAILRLQQVQSDRFSSQPHFARWRDDELHRAC